MLRRHWNNSFSPVLGGALTRKIAYDRDGKLNQTINNLYESLSRGFDMKDVVGALLLDLLIADFWRLSQGIKDEKRRLAEPRSLATERRICRYGAPKMSSNPPVVWI